MNNFPTQTKSPFVIHDEINLFRTRSLNKQLGKTLEKLSGLQLLNQVYEKNPELLKETNSQEYLDKVFNILNIKYEFARGNTHNIPKDGPLVIVANHPFGALDGLILAHILQTVRPDTRILANKLLKRFDSLADLFIDVDPINQKASMKKNSSSLRNAMRWVKGGGCLIVFPAGEVSNLKLRQKKIIDSEWSLTIAKLVRLTKANVMPIYFHGHNSIPFQLVGLCHPILRTLLLPREILKKSHQRIQLSLGKAIKFSKLKELDDKALIHYLRVSTYALSSKEKKAKKLVLKKTENSETQDTIANKIPTSLLHEEIKQLPTEQTLLQVKDIQLIHAQSKQVPWVMQEIGRLREVTFREVGEGTGKGSDIDIYDSYYEQLFMWDTKQQCIVGAYRLGLVDDILNQYGVKGLYSYSLFKYSKSAINRLGNSIELGRSFIRKEYQRSPICLSLLWKGIAQFIVKQNKYTVLFGPVSISNDYNKLSQRLIIDCLRSNRLMKTLSKKVKPRTPFRNTQKTAWKKKDLNRIDDINLISQLISQLEDEDRGVPILIKQYLKLGGKFIEFNIDQDFNDCVDGLIIVDLKETEKEFLEYFVGKENINMPLFQKMESNKKLKLTA